MKESYADKLARDNSRILAVSRDSRDIAKSYPQPGDIARRDACSRDFRLFCETFFPAVFTLAWSPDHFRVVGRMQQCVLDGGLFALAMPRGSGKTALTLRAALWALLFGHRRFVVLIGATEEAAENLLRQLKSELQFNDLLAEDFRHVCYPIRRLENNARRCNGQLFLGERTSIEWSAKRVILPTIPMLTEDPSAVDVSGSCVSVAGITGAIRGQSLSLPTGETLRPDLALIDDPQTRESAMSPSQSADRLAIIGGDVLGLAGPGKKIAALVPCTVIRGGDAADQLLDRQRNPQWQGERTSAVTRWPSNSALWEKYLEIRADSLRRGDGGKAATEFYRLNRAAMDEGAVVAWPERFNPDELSAIQHNVNLRADLGEHAFQAEYQNLPLQPSVADGPTLTAAEVAGRTNRVPRGVVPVGTTTLTAGIDVHDGLLVWAVTSWHPNFTGSVVDYGVWPEQDRRNFTLRKATRTLADLAPGAGREGAIHAGLKTLCDRLIGREWKTESGSIVRIDRCLIDSGYLPDLVFNFCRRSEYATALYPSRGLGIGAAKTPMAEYPKKPGERHGSNWIIRVPGSRAARSVIFDANLWKTFVAARLTTAIGDKGSLTLFGTEEREHTLFSEHITAEMPRAVSSGGRTVQEWTMRPGHEDNHWWDCLILSAVAANIQGVSLDTPGGSPLPKPRRKKVTWGEAQRRAEERLRS